jgi:hypothetical protein
MKKKHLVFHGFQFLVIMIIMETYKLRLIIQIGVLDSFKKLFLRTFSGKNANEPWYKIRYEFGAKKLKTTISLDFLMIDTVCFFFFN